MVVIVTQFNDGIQSGDEATVEPISALETALEILVRKANSHIANGWAVTWNGTSLFHASKDKSWGRVDRYFSIKVI